MIRMGENVIERNFLKDFFPNTNNNSGLVPITEANAKSLLNKHSKTGYIIVSACRGGADFGLDPINDRVKLNTINNRRTKELYSDINKAGFSFTPTYGGFIENQGEPEEEQVYEKSFMVYPFTKEGKPIDFGVLTQFAIDTAKKYNQDDVLVCQPGENPQYFDKEGNVDMSFTGGTTFNDATQTYFTDLHKNTHKSGLKGRPTRFSFNEIYINPAPQCLSESHKRHLSGEKFIPYLKG